MKACDGSLPRAGCVCLPRKRPVCAALLAAGDAAEEAERVILSGAAGVGVTFGHLPRTRIIAEMADTLRPQ